MTASEADPSPLPSSSQPRDGAGASGEWVVLGLFVLLALGVVAVFALFWVSTRPEDRDFIVPVVLRDLYLPVVATALLVAIDARRRGRSGWWVYLAAAPVPGLNVVLSVLWLARWRRVPRTWLRWTL